MNEGYSYEQGATWLPPIKRIAADEYDHLRLYWWKNNEMLKGTSIYRQTDPVEVYAAEHNSLGNDVYEAVVSDFRLALPFDQGIVVELEMTANCRDTRSTMPWSVSRRKRRMRNRCLDEQRRGNDDRSSGA